MTQPQKTRVPTGCYHGGMLTSLCLVWALLLFCEVGTILPFRVPIMKEVSSHLISSPSTKPGNGTRTGCLSAARISPAAVACSCAGSRHNGCEKQSCAHISAPDTRAQDCFSAEGGRRLPLQPPWPDASGQRVWRASFPGMPPLAQAPRWGAPLRRRREALCYIPLATLRAASRTCP